MTEQATSLLSHHAREVIDGWVAKYPADQKQSAVLAALREVQHENQGFITTELMDAVADYLAGHAIARSKLDRSGSFTCMPAPRS